jgi:pimeloyl-ACP methyl ester carboxylesterase
MMGAEEVHSRYTRRQIEIPLKISDHTARPQATATRKNKALICAMTILTLLSVNLVLLRQSVSSPGRFKSEKEAPNATGMGSMSTRNNEISCRADVPELHEIPEELFPTYRELPNMVKAIVFAIMAGFAHFPCKKELPRRNRGRAWTLLLFIILFRTTNFVLQDVFLPPSRISTPDLIAKFHLPSTLSHYEKVTLFHGQQLSVHSLRHDQHYLVSPNFTALYLNHGFGASSLSWLPVLSRLSERLGVRSTVAHDAVGFGFTDRPTGVAFYTPAMSAEIGLHLLNKTESNSLVMLPTILVGHSMGSITTLEMASKFPFEKQLYVLLVAPALGMSPRKKANTDEASPVVEFMQTYLFGPPLRYLLRRLVGIDSFWINGLKLFAWGNPNEVTDSDILRFQWPAISVGWEDGLLRFVRATSGYSDGDLLARVANRPNTRIFVVLGEKDMIVSRQTVERVFADFPEISIVEMKGCGHDPFEEKVGEFLDLVERLLSK